MNGHCHWACTPDKILELQLSLFPSCHKADSPLWPHGCFMMCRATTGPKHGDQPWPAPKQAIPLPWRLPWGFRHSNSKLTSTIAIISAQSCSAMDLRDIFQKENSFITMLCSLLCLHPSTASLPRSSVDLVPTWTIQGALFLLHHPTNGRALF